MLRMTFSTFRVITSQSGQARAELIIERILETISTISYMPGMGIRRPFLNRGSLAFLVPPWLIIYRSLPDLDGIEVIRVVDSRRDLRGML
jgi:plasmid stabilization system protein ParE